MNEVFIGELAQFPYNFCPAGLDYCHGQLMPIHPNEALFSLLGTAFGGDGKVTFALPNLRKSKADGSYYSQGEQLPDGTPYIESYICVEGIYPTRN